MKTRMFRATIIFVGIWGAFIGIAGAQDSIYSFSGDVGMVNKYIWRGQRLTNDWSLQPSMTLHVSDFSLNIWGTMDLAKVNEGSVGRRLLVPENPAAPPGAKGLRYRFSEVDYTLSYDRSFEPVSVGGGMIAYTFPDRSEMTAWTTEVYGSIGFNTLPLAPSATLYVDVDEGQKRGLGNGMYLLLDGGHSFATGHPTFGQIDISGSLGFADASFGQLYYDPTSTEAGLHDASLTLGLPVQLGEALSVRGFATYSALIGGFRDYQFRDLRAVYLGTAGSPATFADTVTAGATLSLNF